MRECQRRASKKWESENVERMKESRKKWYQLNKVQLKKKRTMERLESILKSVAEYYDVPVESVYSKSRKLKYVRVRQVYFYLAYCIANKRLIEIGDLVNCEHCTVMYGRRKIENEMLIYPQMYDDIQILTSIIKPQNKIVVENVDMLV